MTDQLSKGIQSALSGDFDFGDFAEGFSAIFADTLASSIAAALAPTLTAAAQNFGDVLTQAFSSGTQAAGGGPGGAAGTGINAAIPGGGGLTYGGAALGGAAFGGVAGGIYAQAAGLKPGNQAALGGAIGGATGAVGGQILIPVPVVGALIGGAVGTAVGAFAGGLIGGENNLGNDRSAQQYRASRGITYSDVSFSPENRDITAGIIGEVSKLQDALQLMGGAVADFGLRIEAGNKSGITVNGVKYKDAQAALAASLEKLIGSTTGLTASQQTVLANTKATTAQGIGADLQIAEQFDQLTFTGTELERQLQALDKQMVAFAQRAGELGLSVDAVAAAHAREAEILIAAETARRNEINASIESLAPSGNQLELAFSQLNDRVQALARAATAAGIPLDGLVAAHQRAAAAIVAAQQQLVQGLNLQVATIDPRTNPLDLAFAQLEAQMQGLAAQLVAAGQPIDHLAAVHTAAADKIVADYNAAQQAQAEAAAGQRRPPAAGRSATAGRPAAGRG